MVGWPCTRPCTWRAWAGRAGRVPPGASLGPGSTNRRGTLAQHHGFLNLLSPAFIADGFCIANKHDIYTSSHTMCFYSDTFFVVLLWGLVRLSRGTVSDEASVIVERQLFGIFMHGAAHFAVGYKATLEPTHRGTREGH